MANYKEIAEKIVKELKGIIGKDFNYIDTDGKIIASTDPKRVGTYHEGGYIAAKKKMMSMQAPKKESIFLLYLKGKL